MALVALTLVGLYTVTTRSTHETYEDDKSSEETSKADSTSAAAASNVADAKDAERIDGMVFKAFMDEFGVPPPPAHSRHYAALVVNEHLDAAGLAARMENDSQKALEKAAPNPKTEKFEAKDKSPSDAEADTDMQALRDKAQRLAKMSGPVSKDAEDGNTKQLASKLRGIAGQVSELARQYDIPINSDKEAPKGIESFISF